jgi:hypothetical protein
VDLESVAKLLTGYLVYRIGVHFLFNLQGNVEIFAPHASITIRVFLYNHAVHMFLLLKKNNFIKEKRSINFFKFNFFG